MPFRNLIFVAAMFTLPSGQATAQSAAGKSTKTTPWTTPRTPDGHPDFQGVWANNSATPLERPKVVEGRMNGWFKERCLLEQSYAKDEKRTIADLVGSAEIVRFAQVVVGG